MAATQPVTLNLPTPLYEQLQERAAQARRSLEQEALDMLASALPTDESLPLELATALESLDGMDDRELQQVMRSRLSEDVSSELEWLHERRQREGLSEAESRRLEDLVGQYERHMLMRAQAAAVLKQRGHATNELLAS